MLHISLSDFEPVFSCSYKGISCSHNKETEVELLVKAHLNTYVSVRFNCNQLRSNAHLTEKCVKRIICSNLSSSGTSVFSVWVEDHLCAGFCLSPSVFVHGTGEKGCLKQTWVRLKLWPCNFKMARTQYFSPRWSEQSEGSVMQLWPTALWSGQSHALPSALETRLPFGEDTEM